MGVGETWGATHNHFPFVTIILFPFLQFVDAQLVVFNLEVDLEGFSLCFLPDVEFSPCPESLLQCFLAHGAEHFLA